VPIPPRPATPRPAHATPASPEPGEVLLRGTPASPGVAPGPVRVVTGLDDFEVFRAGDVLVCRTTSPAWTPLLARAAAVVTEVGGVLAHAAIVAREFGIPAVLAVAAATTTLADGQQVVVDGSAGVVTAARTTRGTGGPPHAG
jgi:pyruvate, water dikinase